MEKYWITLYPDTFIWVKEEQGVIYNSKSFKTYSFPVNKRIKKICLELLLPANLYTTMLTSEEMKDDDIKNWIHCIIEDYAAGYLTDGENEKPISYKPIPKILNDREYFIWEHKQGFGGNVMQNIHELTFYINATETGNESYYMQVVFPQKKGEILACDKIISFIRRSQNPFLINVNLVGNLFIYPDYRKLISEIENLNVNCTIQITIQDFTSHMQDIQDTKWSDHVQFNVLMNFSCFHLNPDDLLNNTTVPVRFSMFISSEEDYDLSLDRINYNPKFSDAKIIPIYNGNNRHFFEKNIFMGVEDFNEIELTKRDIFMHQALNTSDFGKLTILANDLVFSNVNMLPLGTIDDTVFSLVYKELTEGQSWFRIRDMQPCCDCVYQWLCPSPSNYELAIGKPNLCHVKP